MKEIQKVLQKLSREQESAAGGGAGAGAGGGGGGGVRSGGRVFNFKCAIYSQIL